MLNIFRLSADLLHLASIIILLLKIYATKNVKVWFFLFSFFFFFFFVSHCERSNADEAPRHWEGKDGGFLRPG